MNNYINYDWMRKNNNDLYNVEDAFMKGNLWKEIYNPYKNYQPQTLRPTSEKEKCLYELMATSFASHELNLYLDLHPEDQSMFMLFTDYQRKANRLMEEYEQKFGPLMINSEEMNQSYTWTKSEWPWEGRNV